MAKQRIFTDVNLSFAKHPVTGDVPVKADDEAIKTSLKNLLTTRNYEVPFHPEIGSPIYSLLFEPVGHVTANVMKRVIRDVVSSYEPRVALSEVNVTPMEDSNSYSVEVVFYIVSRPEPITFTTILQRQR